MILSHMMVNLTDSYIKIVITIEFLDALKKREDLYERFLPENFQLLKVLVHNKKCLV